MGKWRVGVDSGGTFTDVCMFDETARQVKVWKVSSTPDDPSRGIAQGVEEGLKAYTAVSADAPLTDVAYLGHGTTVATNALIEHRGAKLGLITTQGFRDLLEIGRQKRPSLYDMFAQKPRTLVPRHLRFEVAERLLHDGTVDIALDEAAVRAAAKSMAKLQVEAVAICFLYAFVNPAHEARAAEIVAHELPDVFICTSHEIAPEFREFERLSTATVNSYLGPIMHRYIKRLSQRFNDLGLVSAPHLTQSNGGVVSFDAAARTPVRSVLSGPSTGVVAAEVIGLQAGYRDIITFDMGGTSSDVALMRGGHTTQANEAVVHGYPIKAPMLDIHTVGAGGGSIAHIDTGGFLKVGPRSAGADPGPVCYGRGNHEPTVTDANIVLQVLNPTHILGGRLQIHRDLAVRAMQVMADRLGLGVMETAQGIISVVTANMARAIRVISVQRGHDPRNYALMAFGGAGPLHAVRLAQELDIGKVFIPRNPGTLCAMGLLLTDLRANFSVTRLTPITADHVDDLSHSLQAVATQANAWFDGEGIAQDAQRVILSIDIRYEGQNYELSIPVHTVALTAAVVADTITRFEAEHSRMYGFIAEGEKINAVTFRAEAIGLVDKADLPERPMAGPDPQPAKIGQRDVWFPETENFTPSLIYSRDMMTPGMILPGPAVIEQMDTTTLVPPGWTATVDRFENLIMEIA
ncbi:methylhydantoinase [Thioclava sp. SK-1]|uniref:hydantoinase/oxoprolinase family protein n=1 Tax=Thioclava sp. SK-1 TaxID=1889770 RepID=UPI00082633A2|nr:hydantoinase/oxoprolinase family protein [Thioclava sp. SK-1]OCX58175.1 methylhydantoinase [Thioclava sp. SK-1]